ncbi:putative adhesin [Actinoplanes sp. NPDC026623]|uniref:putative adhesin n=1 Tax=Actinoplanes sp. NPDC026623 TaxID=3155610 RepID=UPI003411D92A
MTGKKFTVPAGSSIAFYGEHGYTISRQRGRRISGGGIRPLEVDGPGQEAPALRRGLVQI